MKKLMRKLVLSSFALGLAVITLSTTTFAWYTSNVNVTADGINGNTATSGADLLMITQEYDTVNKTPINFETSITVEQTGEQTMMIPTSYVSWGNYAQLGSKNAENKVTDNGSSTGYITFTLYFKLASMIEEGKTVNLYISQLEIINTTGATYTEGTGWSREVLPTKDVLAEGRSYLNTKGESTYTIDVLRTLMMNIKSEVYESTTGSIVTTPKENSDVELLLNLQNMNKNAYDDDFENGVSNAHEYYNAIMDADLTSTTQKVYDDEKTVSSSTGSPLAINVLPEAGDALTSNSYLKVEFVVFMNGWDLACFDACQGQSFVINMGFTTDSDKALKISDSAAE